MRGSVSWKITTCNCSRVAPSYGKICTAIGVRIWKRSPAWRERRDEMTSAMQARSEEHTSELQSLMRISYAVFCLKKKKNLKQKQTTRTVTRTIQLTNEQQVQQTLYNKR